MNPSFSRYLDLLRILAAMTVFLSHAGHGHLVGGALWRFTYWGHEAVILFFVLSGYVISHVASSRETDIAVYAVARLSRLYSVILPVMLITWACDQVGQSLFSHAYTSTGLVDARMPEWAGYGLSITMLNQSWGWNTHFGSNAAFWSIPFEFWYYALFGSFFFLNGLQKWIATLFIGLIAGPRILAMLPIWLLGVLAQQRNERSPPFPMAVSGALSLSTALLLLAMLQWDVTHKGQWHLGPIQINNWWWDLIFGLLSAIHIRAVHGLLTNLHLHWPDWSIAALKRLAGSTLALYLLHLPLLSFLNALAHHFGGARAWTFAYLVAPILISLTLGYRLENTKHIWRRWLSRLLIAGKQSKGAYMAPSNWNKRQ